MASCTFSPRRQSDSVLWRSSPTSVFFFFLCFPPLTSPIQNGFDNMIRNMYDLKVRYFMLTRRDKVQSSTDLHSLKDDHG